MTEVRSAVLWPGSKELAIETLELEDPREGEVLVKIVATGICHTDMVLRDASIYQQGPVVLGHEGAGIVEKLGPGVTGFAVGDRVGISFSSCGSCRSCSREEPAYCDQFFVTNYMGMRTDGSTALRKGDSVVHSHVFGQSSFSTYSVCPISNLVPVDDDFPLELAGPFGCGFQTGAGAVLNTLDVAPEDTLAVLGAGAVGLAAVAAAAKIAGVRTVIAVDINAQRLEVAREMGATHTINGAEGDIEEQLRAICPQGVNHVIDSTARVPLVEQWIGLMALRGNMVLVGSYPAGETMSFDAVTFMISGKRIQGVVEGDSDIHRFIPELMRHYREGRFPVDKLVKYYDFEDINRAIHDSECGDVIKAIVKMP